jgi:DNA adenine methylase
MKPFLKWAGGKRWLVRRYPQLFDLKFNRYIEPFVGSGAVFFDLQPQRGIISDVNPALMNVYSVLRSDYRRVWVHLLEHARNHSDEYYYEVRSKAFRSDASRAAQFIYLNRTCWNGLYRENLRGEFNVPRGTKDTIIFADDDFAAVSEALASTKIMSGDFEKVFNAVKEDDFVFIDPPYTVKHNGNGFVKYNESIFSWNDQVRLANAVKLKARSGASILVTNAYHSTVIELYRSFATIVPVERASILSGDKSYRGKTQEALILVGSAWKGVEVESVLEPATMEFSRIILIFRGHEGY